MTLDESVKEDDGQKQQERFVPPCRLKNGQPDVFIYFEDFHCHRLDVECPYRNTISVKLPSYKPEQPYTFVAAYCTYFEKDDKKGS